jgi:hypothetical protein
LGGEPALEALQFVRTYGGLSDADLDKIDRKFNLTTLRRLIESRAVREKIGIDVKDGRLYSALPAEELIKPLRQFVLDVATGDVSSRKLHKTEHQVSYVDKLPAESRPKLSKAGSSRAISEIAPSGNQAKPAKPKTRTRATLRPAPV